MYRFLPAFFVIALLVICYTYLPIRREVFYRLHISQDPTVSCCDTRTVEQSNGDFDERATVAFFNGELIDYPKTSLAQLNHNTLYTNILGTINNAGEEKWIEVSLDEQRLRAWESNKVVMEFPISAGRWASTPKGTFNIWYKTRYQLMSGGSKELGTYYYLPNVPHNMFFYQGYAIHGAYWHNNFGHPMSHGCVNEPLANASQIFDWAGPVVPPDKNTVRASAENPGTRVWVH